MTALKRHQEGKDAFGPSPLRGLLPHSRGNAASDGVSTWSKQARRLASGSYLIIRSDIGSPGSSVICLAACRRTIREPAKANPVMAAGYPLPATTCCFPPFWSAHETPYCLNPFLSNQRPFSTRIGTICGKTGVQTERTNCLPAPRPCSPCTKWPLVGNGPIAQE